MRRFSKLVLSLSVVLSAMGCADEKAEPDNRPNAVKLDEATKLMGVGLPAAGQFLYYKMDPDFGGSINAVMRAPEAEVELFARQAKLKNARWNEFCHHLNLSYPGSPVQPESIKKPSCTQITLPPPGRRILDVLVDDSTDGTKTLFIHWFDPD